MTKLKLILALTVFLWGIGAAASASAQVAVVVNASHHIDTLSPGQVAKIFLGRSHRLPDGTKVIPLDQMEGKQSRHMFYDRVVQKNPSQLNSYWSRLIFTGRGQPPYTVANDAEVLEFISANPNTIGYVNLDAIAKDPNLKNVKVLLKVE